MNRQKPLQHSWLTREQLQPVILIIVTSLVAGLCLSLIVPFLAPLTWALVLAIIAYPLHTRVLRRINRRSLAAAVSVTLVTGALLAPLAFVSVQIGREALSSVETVKQGLDGGRWRTVIERNPRLAPLLEWIEGQVNLQSQVARLSEEVASRVAQFVSGSAHVVVGWLITLFLLFYFLRDRQPILVSIREYIPLARPDTDRLFHEVRDTIYAIVYGTLMVALLQGVLGGLMFWWLGLPAPILWGAVMAFLAILPVMGAAIVWIPAALFLLLEGGWEKALILTGWGGIVVALVDNLVYPILVKNRLHRHTVPVFLSMLGGLVIFGAAGIVLGPTLLAMMIFLFNIWRRRIPADEEATG